jgi:hypothetical protein
LDKASIALIVSITSASVSLLALGWQLTLYRLSGARLRVQLVFEFHDALVTTRSLTGTRRGSWPSVMVDSSTPADNRFGIECVRVRVTNVGRAAVSVEHIALDVGRTHRWQRGRKTYVPWVFHDPNATDSNGSQGASPDHVRLEAGAVTSQVFHLWPIVSVETAKLRDGEKVTIRGTARAAGRRPTLSPRRVAWRFRRGDESWFTECNVTPEMRVYRALWKASYSDYVGGLPLLMHRQVSEKLSEGATPKDIEEYLNSLRPDGIFGMAAYEAHEAFHLATAQRP